MRRGALCSRPFRLSARWCAVSGVMFASESGDSDSSPAGRRATHRRRSRSRRERGTLDLRGGSSPAVAPETPARAPSPSGPHPARASSPSGPPPARAPSPSGLPPALPNAGRKQRRPAHSERTSGRWIKDLLEIAEGLGHARPQLQRPLVVHSMHTGTNSFRMFFRMAGIEVADVLGAEKKAHARCFVRQNSLEPGRFYTDTADMLAECRAPAEIGYTRADIFASGFPCQPFSRMTRRAGREPREHPLYKEFETATQYVMKTEPRTCLFENVLAFTAEQGERDDESDPSPASRQQGSSGMAVLTQALGSKYHIAYSVVDLSCWVEIRRPRVFIWCLRKDCGSQEDISVAARLADDMQAERRRTQPEAVEHHLFIDGTATWFTRVACELFRRRGGPQQKPGQSQKPGPRAWEQEARHIRKWLRDAGRPWANEHPLAAAQLKGLEGTERQRAVLEGVLLAHCHWNDLDPRDEEHLQLARQGLKWDISQNVHRSHLRGLRGCECSCLCTGALLYSFEVDRLIHPAELLSCFGWPGDVDCSGLGRRSIADLIGESQALQAIGVATLALLTSCQKACGWQVAQALPGLRIPSRRIFGPIAYSHRTAFRGGRDPGKQRQCSDTAGKFVCHAAPRRSCPGSWAFGGCRRPSVESLEPR